MLFNLSSYTESEEIWDQILMSSREKDLYEKMKSPNQRKEQCQLRLVKFPVTQNYCEPIVIPQ